MILEDGIYISEKSVKQHRAFVNCYNQLRNAEARLLTADEIRLLPHTVKSSPDHHVWMRRQKSVGRFLRYLNKKQNLKILEVGCGYGFISAALARNGHRVTALDVNPDELRLGRMAFSDLPVMWYCADLLIDPLPETDYDVVFFSASLQYFKDVPCVLDKCFSLMKPGGEVHIFDTPFYKNHTKAFQAAERSNVYLSALGANDLLKNYFFLTRDVLNSWEYKSLYQPAPKLLGFLSKFDSPFPWLKLTRRKKEL